MLPNFVIKTRNTKNVLKAISRTIYLLLLDRIERKEKNEWSKEDEINIYKLLQEHLLWKISENLDKTNGKYEGCLYWTKGAIESFRKYKRVENKKKYIDALEHEHIYPRKQFSKYLLSKYLSNVNEKLISDELFKKGFAVVVTKSEHLSINDDHLDENDVWARYQKAGLLIYYHKDIPRDIVQILDNKKMLFREK